MALDTAALPFHESTASIQRKRRRPLLELATGYGLILATIWTPRPYQHWFYLAAVIWVAATTAMSFPGWAAMGFRRGGFFASLWVVFAAAMFMAISVTIAVHLHTLRHPISGRGWVMTFGGYTVWSFVQQFLMQGYFLFRLLHIVPRREWAAVASAAIFALAHLPNPILTSMTLIWGFCACFVFLRCRNVYPLALAHALLGITVAITIPGPVVRNMRVGLGYLHYHAPHAQTPGLEPSLLKPHQ
jgi:hypothetical protein